ncbi:MAG TPA: NUDIX hydrolase, partial [Vicinamibacteria bacterium]|nr:NUDIX hydrolase [Vicinamibacteria bacterium]
MRVRHILAGLVLTSAAAFGAAREWGPDQTRPILEKTLVVRLAPALDSLSPGERRALDALLAAGPPLQRIYERQLHRQALDAHRALLARQPRRDDLLTLYRLWQGPIATTLDNEREPFLPVDPIAPGKNVYPWGIDKARLESFLEEHGEAKDDILNGRTVVREAGDVPADLAALAARPGLAALHPELEARIRAGAAGYYAIPYALAYADDLDEAGSRLLEAASAVRADDEDLADYLENRRRDFLTNDYESGDASWIMGSFG